MVRPASPVALRNHTGLDTYPGLAEDARLREATRRVFIEQGLPDPGEAPPDQWVRGCDPSRNHPTGVGSTLGAEFLCNLQGLFSRVLDQAGLGGTARPYGDHSALADAIDNIGNSLRLRVVNTSGTLTAPLFVGIDDPGNSRGDLGALLLADSSGGALTLTLPRVADWPEGGFFVVRREGGSNITLGGYGQAPIEKINGAGELVLAKDGAWALVIRTGDGWRALTAANDTSTLFSTVATSASITADAGKSYAATAGATNIDITLPAAAMAGDLVEVSKTDAGPGFVNIRGTIDGSQLGDRLHREGSSGLYLALGKNAWRRIGERRHRIQVLHASPVTTDITVPPGVTGAYVSVVGGGGGSSSGAGGTGGSGGYAYGWLALTPGEVISATIGVGGAGAISGGQAGDGGESYFGSYITCGGGTGGNAGPGSGGSATGGDIQILGRCGVDLDGYTKNAVGSPSSWPGSIGGHHGTPSSGGGEWGLYGASGGANPNTAAPGGNGGDGAVLFEFKG